MKRDMDFVRQLLIDISNGKCKIKFDRNSEDDKKYIYHLKILKQAGFIDFKLNEFFEGAALYDVPELTWEGNDYLESISNETIWNKTKNTLKEKGLELSEVPFHVLKAYAATQIKQILGID